VPDWRTFRSPWRSRRVPRPARSRRSGVLAGVSWSLSRSDNASSENEPAHAALLFAPVAEPPARARRDLRGTAPGSLPAGVTPDRRTLRLSAVSVGPSPATDRAVSRPNLGCRRPTPAVNFSRTLARRSAPGCGRPPLRFLAAAWTARSPKMSTPPAISTTSAPHLISGERGSMRPS